MPAKRKPSTRKVTTRSPRSRNEVPINEIALEAKRLFGWDPRITEYIADERKIKTITEDKMFSIQHPAIIQNATLFGFSIREIGALADEKTHVNHRIVQLTRIEPEAVAE